MAHKRKNPDWELRGFAFWAKMTNESYKDAEVMEAYHKERQWLIEGWNALVDVFWRSYDARNALLRQDPTVADLEKQIAKVNIDCQKAHRLLKDAKMHRGYATSQLGEEADMTSEESLKAELDKLRNQHNALRDTLRKERKRAARALGVPSEKDNEARAKAAAALAKLGFGSREYMHREALTESFINARKKFLTGKGGPLRLKDPEETIGFHLRYANGGKPVYRALPNGDLTFNLPLRSKYFHFEPEVGPKGHATFYWRFGNHMAKFYTILHRPLPEKGRLKSVHLSKDVHQRWRLVLQIEEPPREKLPHGEHAVNFFPGWKGAAHVEIKATDPRTLEEITQRRATMLHIGSIQYDTNPRENIYLFAEHHAQQRQDQTAPFFDIMPRLAYLDLLQKEADAALNDVRKQLAERKDVYDSLWTGSVLRSGAKRLETLLHTLDGLPHATEEYLILKKGLQTYRRKMQKKNDVERRLIRCREWTYWNFGQSIAKKAKVVYWNELNHEQLGRKKDIEPITEKAAQTTRRWKKLAAIGRLQQIVEQQCHKRGVDVIEYPVKEALAA